MINQIPTAFPRKYNEGNRNILLENVEEKSTGKNTPINAYRHEKSLRR